MDDFANIEPVHYKLSYEPNLETFIFQGRMEFDFTLLAPSSSIKLHALDITVRQLHRSENGQMIELSHTTDLSNQLMTIEFDRELSGNVKLIAEFTGEHNDKLAGWYRGKFRDVQGMEHYCVVSQFQANDARRAFPCVDIPGKKATFDIDFLVDKDLMAISNMPIDRQEEENGKKRVYFGRTPTMSTYLLFYGVGDFEAIEKTSNGTLYRTIAHPPKAVNNGQFSLDFGVEVVEYMEEYFDFDYPLPKLDQIATPAFAAGAMENWGAILYRENALLYYDGITSETQTNGILGVIAHEIAHQWFGNLVSPTTWKYLWLNESFATFFASHVVDALRPERRVFENYVYSTNLARGARSTSGVMDWDTMIATSPIELDGDGEISFTAKTVPILYAKGGSILRFVKAYVGDDGFRDGLRAYFKKHAYGASISNYLWESLEEATGKPVSKMMNSFVLQKGLPLITVQRNGGTLTLSQQRFTFLPHESDTLWFTPVSVKLFKGGQPLKEVTLELDEKTKSFDLGEFDAYKLNSDMTGFYRVHYPEQDYAMLKELVRSKAITPIDRLVLEHELFALLRAGRISLDLYLDFIEAYADETSHMSLMSIAVHLRDIHRLAEADLKSSLEAQAVAFLDRTFNKIGFAKKSDEDLGISIIRGPLLSIAVDFDSDAAKQFALAQFDKLKAGERIDANIRTNVKAAAAKLTNDWDWFKSDFDNPENEAEFISTISAMNKFTEKPLLNKYMDMIFSDIPSRNRGIAIAGLSSNKLVKTEMFEWYLANLDSFEALNNFMVQGAILSVVSTGDENQAEMEEFFADYVKKNPKFADAVEVSIEQLNITKAFKTHLN